MANNKKKLNKTALNLIVDTGLLAGFTLLYDPDNTGLFLHEWLGLGFGAAIVGHILLHWKWVVQTTLRFFSRLARQARINYLLNTLLFIDVTAIMFTGLMISQKAAPGLNSQSIPDGFWLFIHEAAAAGGIALIGTHVALHWKWILNAGKRFILKPVVRLGATAPQHLQQQIPQQLQMNPIQIRKEN